MSPLIQCDRCHFPGLSNVHGNAIVTNTVECSCMTRNLCDRCHFRGLSRPKIRCGRCHRHGLSHVLGRCDRCQSGVVSQLSHRDRCHCHGLSHVLGRCDRCQTNGLSLLRTLQPVPHHTPNYPRDSEYMMILHDCGHFRGLLHVL